MNRNELWLEVYVRAVVAFAAGPGEGSMATQCEAAAVLADAAVEQASIDGRLEDLT